MLGNCQSPGIDLTQLDDKQLSQFRNESIGFVFQFHNLLSEFTALETSVYQPSLREQIVKMPKNTSRVIDHS